jgi:hypothetical protein
MLFERLEAGGDQCLHLAARDTTGVALAQHSR